MTAISRQLDLPYSTEQMYALVNDVARYPEFVPWCKSALIHFVDQDRMRASLVIEWQGARSTVTTENKLIENQSITMNLVQGMIKHLTGQWQFIAKGDKACQVKLSIQLEFKSRLMGLLFSKVMQQVLNRITDAFYARALVLYG
jgi:ribosome-associated toxin RatA of RatAB toxin-antitoxin module